MPKFVMPIDHYVDPELIKRLPDVPPIKGCEISPWTSYAGTREYPLKEPYFYCWVTKKVTSEKWIRDQIQIHPEEIRRNPEPEMLQNLIESRADMAKMCIEELEAQGAPV